MTGVAPPPVPPDPPPPVKPRRTRGLGSVFQRADGLWVAQLRGKHVPDGAVTRYFASEADAENGLAALRAAVAGRTLPDAAARRGTVAELLDDWLAAKEGTIEPESLRRHRENSALRLTPGLGAHKVVELRPEHVRRLYARLHKAGQASARTIRYTHVTLHLALEQAVRDGRLPRNVAALVAPPKLPPTEKQALSPAAVRRLVQAAPSQRLGALWITAVYTGARLGELLAMRWQDLDLARGRWHVQRALGKDADKRPILKEPKRAASRRSLPLRPLVIAALQQRRQTQDRERDAAGRAWDGKLGIVFATERGTLVNESNVENRDWPAMATAANLPEWATPHTLRHTFASALLAAGRPLAEVSRLLGHGSIATTANVYAHWIRQAPDEAVEALESVYGAGEESPEL